MRVRSDRSLNYFRLLLFSLAGLYLVLFLYTAIPRVFFPYDLEWAEGAALLQVDRVLSGEGIYTSPSLDFSPLVYPPLYYYLSALLSLLIGEGFLALRLVSVLSSMGTAALIFWVVVRETKDGFAAWISGALYLACFQLSDGFYDLARVDSLFVLILLLIVVLWRNFENGWIRILVGLLIPFAIFTKQTAVIIFLPLIVYSGIKYLRKSIPFFVILAAGVGIPILIWDTLSQGWFAYYTFKLPQEHGYSILDAIGFWVGDTLGPLGIAFGIAFIFIFLGRGTTQIVSTEEVKRHSQGAEEDRKSVYLIFFFGCLLGSWITRASNGGAANNLMPTYAGLCILFGFGYRLLRDKISCALPKSQKGRTFLIFIVGIQFIGLLYNPFTYIPTQADQIANEKLLNFIDERRSEVLIPYRSHLPSFVGKETHIHVVSMFELFGYFHGEVQPSGEKILANMRNKICRQEYSAVILDQPLPWIHEDLERYYLQADSDLLEISEDRSEVLKWQNGLNNIYLPAKSAQESLDCK